MCLIALAVDPPGPWRLVLAANRDEFHDRHTASAAYWDSIDHGLLAGKDLQGGGTWLGLRRMPEEGSLRIAALTNLRPGLMPAPAARTAVQPAVPPSRGQLVRRFLSANAPPEAFLRDLDPPGNAYSGFNLMVLSLGTVLDVWYLNNLFESRPRPLDAGLHLLSNATLDVPWPKTVLLAAALSAALQDARQEPVEPAEPAGPQTMDGGDGGEGLCEHLFDALADRTLAADAALPQTGLDHDRERMLSAPFIVDDHYGTRCSTVILVSRAGQVLFRERSFGPGGRPLGTLAERFRMDQH